MIFKEGQRVIAVDNGYNYGSSADLRGPLLTHDYAIGWKGTFGENRIITFDNGRAIQGCDGYNFEELKEETTMNKGDKVKISGCTGLTEEFNGKTGEYLGVHDGWGSTYINLVCFDGSGKDCGLLFADSELTLVTELGIGSKVIMATIGSNASAMEFKDGTLTPSFAVKYEAGIGTTIAVYEITGVVGDQTIIKRISDGKVFFVQQRFLKEYVAPKPKFSVGQIVERGSGYARIAKVNQDLTYIITENPERYKDGSAFVVAKESEFKACL